MKSLFSIPYQLCRTAFAKLNRLRIQCVWVQMLLANGVWLEPNHLVDLARHYNLALKWGVLGSRNKQEFSRCSAPFTHTYVGWHCLLVVADSFLSPSDVHMVGAVDSPAC
jgi:hypothetical protein